MWIIRRRKRDSVYIENEKDMGKHPNTVLREASPTRIRLRMLPTKPQMTMGRATAAVAAPEFILK
jgi:hypothetical protein